MVSWAELIQQFDKYPAEKAVGWLVASEFEALKRISLLRGGRGVIFYASAFLEKPNNPPGALILTQEEINGFMAVIHEMDCSKGLTLILHSPGGEINAVEPVVDYLRSKFAFIEVIIPTFAMSAATMISLSADKIIMGRASQLGPIDPQILVAGRRYSAKVIVEQFDEAREEILENKDSAHIWAPILQHLGPGLLHECRNSLAFGENMVSDWLAKYMFKNLTAQKSIDKAQSVAKHFSDASIHKNHGRRINREEALGQGLVVENLEDDQNLQDSVMTAYHLMSVRFSRTATTKMLLANTEKSWLKSPQ